MDIYHYDSDKHPLNVALELSQHGQLDAAERILRSLPQDDLRVQYNLGYYDIRAGNLLKGMEGMNVGRWLRTFGSPAISTKPLWKDQPLHNKTLLFHSEGGYGDHIINIRFAKMFTDMGARVVVSTYPSMFELFRQLPWIYQLVSSDTAHGVDHDYWVPAMAAPYVLGLTAIDATPYISRYEYEPSDKLRVGIRWSGNPQFEHEQNRRFDPRLMLQLADTADVQLYSFQRDTNLQALPSQIIDLQHELIDWTDTQKWISSMDLMITSCTSVAHLSAAMGVPTWVIVPCLPYYVWVNDDIKWYDSVTVYKQQTFGDWSHPFQQIYADIEEQLCMQES